MSTLPPMIQALLRPEAYPHRPGHVELVQTQMSFVFLTGDYVYKVKKPVDLGYLDYTTLDKRLRFCRQEVALNRRLCPDAYLGVVSIVRRGEQFFIEAEGEALEYAVKMRQLPQERMMDRLLLAGQVTPDMVRQVAGRMARFHEQAETSPAISAFGGLDAIKTNTDENFDQTEKYIGSTITAEQHRSLKQYTDSFIVGNAPLFQRRVDSGRVRDCHGDLHSAHVCFSNGLCIYDCIEFNDRFRYCDVASEIAFLAMDLDFHGFPALSRHFVTAYAEESGDGDMGQLLAFYKCYRAYVRGKVEGFKLGDPHIGAAQKEAALAAARRYFGLARAYIEGRPTLMITAGLVGTGKTALAQALAARLGAAVITSDIVRKRLAGIAPTERHFEAFDGGIYSPDLSRRTYQAMLDEARGFINSGQSVIMDASYKKRDERLRAAALARDTKANFVILECVAGEATIRERLEQRLREGTTASDGRWEIYQAQKQDFDPIAENEGQHVLVDTAAPVSELARQVMRQNILL